MTRVVLHTDGGARGNPGPAAIGVVAEVVDPAAPGSVVELGEKIGVATNNIAEYRALIRGLEEAARLAATEVECLLDSQLVVEQMSGRFKVKHANVIPLHRQATELGRKFRKVSYRYIPRAQNAAADALVNAALDGKLTPAGARVEQPEMDFDQAPVRPAPAAAAPVSAALELVRRAFRDAVEIPRARLEDLNRNLPEGQRYESEEEVWRAQWGAARAVGRFAVAAGLVTQAELEALEADFSGLRPG